MSGRTRQMLARLPAHFEAARPGKVLGDVFESLAQDLDVLATRLAKVRRAHRLGEAEEVADLLLIAGLHGITAGELEILFLRFARAQKFVDDLRDAAAAEQLIGLWSVVDAHPRLPLFGADFATAKTQLLASAGAALHYARLTDALRARIATICAIHSRGNGTVRAVMEGAANALDLDISPIVHSADRFWHAARVFDRLRLEHPKADGTSVPFAPAEELIGIEENPIRRITTDKTPRQHGDTWTMTRRGFDRVLTQIRVTGVAGGRTVGPMIVNRDEGRGIGYVGTIPEGKTLVFTEEGKALLEGADMTSFAFAWEGACFAEGMGDAAKDFVFDGAGRKPEQRPARFVTTTPPAALNREAVVPHGDATLPVPGIEVGVTRFAFFVQQAHFNPSDELLVPRTHAAFFDGSVFAPPPAFTAPAAEITLSWLEHQAFKARVLIPARFRGLAGDAEGTEVRRRVAIAIERFRPLGVELTIEFIDDRWVIGEGSLSGGETADLTQKLRSATVLWEAPA